MDEVVGIMSVNIEKVLERDAKLSMLDDRSDALLEGAVPFEKSTAMLKRVHYGSSGWRKCKMMIILLAIVSVLLIFIMVWTVAK